MVRISRRFASKHSFAANSSSDMSRPSSSRAIALVVELELWDPGETLRSKVLRQLFCAWRAVVLWGQDPCDRQPGRLTGTVAGKDFAKSIRKKSWEGEELDDSAWREKWRVR